MKHFLWLFCLSWSIFALPLAAQTDGKAMKRQPHDAFSTLKTDSLLRDTVKTDATLQTVETLPSMFPRMDFGAYGMTPLSPWGTSAWGGDWRLHEGFNAQFGMSLTVGLDSHSPSGVGFGEHAAFAYVHPLTDKSRVAGGVYASNFDWGPYRTTDAGFAAMLAWQLSQKVTLYAYGGKSFIPKGRQFTYTRFGSFGTPFSPAWEWDNPKDRFGVAAEFKIGKNAMIGVSVERRTY